MSKSKRKPIAKRRPAKKAPPLNLIEEASGLMLEWNPFPADSWFLQVVPGAKVPLVQQRAALSLTRINMKPAYEKSTWGWNDAEKAQELFHRESLLMLLYQARPLGSSKRGRKAAQVDPFGLDEDFEEASGSVSPQAQLAAEYRADPVAALLHVRFESVEGRLGMYLYELQVARSLQGQRLGEKLLMLAHGVSAKLGRTLACLTVFKANRGAVRFYQRLGYTADESDPEVCGDPDEEYYILSRRLSAADIKASDSSSQPPPPPPPPPQQQAQQPQQHQHRPDE